MILLFFSLLVSCRSPSWGAWIEITLYEHFANGDTGRSPSWGAWIEIDSYSVGDMSKYRRSPSWGAWIEIVNGTLLLDLIVVAPPRGERGLK